MSRLAFLFLACMSVATPAGSSVLAGRLLDWDERPVAGAALWIGPAPTPVMAWPDAPPTEVYARTITADDGSFRIEHHGDVDPVVLHVQPQGRPEHVIENLRWAFDGPLPLHTEIHVPDPGILHGIVMDRFGATVTDAQVWVLARNHEWSAVASARSGADGRFVIAGLPVLTTVEVRACAEGEACRSQSAWMEGNGKARVSVVLPGSRTFEGRILDAQTRGPVRHARLAIVDSTFDVRKVTWWATDDAGRFGVRLDDAARLLLVEPGWAVTELRRGDQHARRAVPVRVRVSKAGRPVAGAGVGWRKLPNLAQTDATGRAVLPRSWDDVLLATQGDSELRCSPAPRGVSELRLPEAIRITGLVTSDGSSRSGPGLTIHAGTGPAVVAATARDGSFVVACLDATNAAGRHPEARESGPLTSVAAMTKGAGAVTVLPPRATHAKLALVRKALLRPDAGDMAPGTHAVARCEAFELPSVPGIVGADGHVEFPRVMPGPWHVVVVEPSGRAAAGSDHAGSGVGGRLVTTEVTTVRVSDDRAGRLADAAIWTDLSPASAWRLPLGWPSPGIATDETGNASLAWVPSAACELGSAHVIPSAPGWSSPVVGIGEQLERVHAVSLHRLGRVRGVVLDSSDMPVPDSIILPLDGDWTTSDECGRFELFASSAHSLAGAVVGDPTACAEVEVSEDDPMRAIVRVPRRKSFLGRVVFDDGIPARDLLVKLEGREFRTDRTGRFTAAAPLQGEPDLELPAHSDDAIMEAERVRGGWLFRVPRPNVATGRVLQAGEPIAGARLRCQARGSFWDPSHWTASDGSAEIHDIGELRDVQCSAWTAEAWSFEGDVTVHHGRFTIELQAPELRQVVVLEEGRPVEGAEVVSDAGRRDFTTFTGTDGRTWATPGARSLRGEVVPVPTSGD